MTSESVVKEPQRRSDHVDLHVAQKVKERRKQLKLSQQDIARLLGISYQQVQKYENGTNRITAGKLFAIATILDVSVNTFFVGLDKPSKDGSPSKASSQIAQISNKAVKLALNDLVDAIAQADTSKARIDLP